LDSDDLFNRGCDVNSFYVLCKSALFEAGKGQDIFHVEEQQLA